MAVHVPFSQRPSGQRHSEPVYIGFEPTRRNRPKFNWWGFNGLFVFFASLGLLSPIALLISLVGLRRRPRKMAVAGTLFSLIGCGVLTAIVISGAQHAQRARERARIAHDRSVNAVKIAETEQLLSMAATEFEQFRDNHDGRLPDDENGASLAIKHIDSWGEEVMYDSNRDVTYLRSSGPDQKFFTGDDVTYSIDGDVELDPLLPVDSE